MRDKSRLLVAAAVLVVGVVLALVIPPGTCPHGGRLDPAGTGGFWCHESDVGYSTSSLIPLKIGVAIGAVVVSATLAAFVFPRRRQASAEVG